MKGRFSHAMQDQDELPWVDNDGDVFVSILAVSFFIMAWF
jgi:hypothetical protein